MTRQPGVLARRLKAKASRELHGRSLGEAAGDLRRLLATRGLRGVVARTGFTIQRHVPRPPEPGVPETLIDPRVGTYAWNIAFNSYFDLSPGELAANAAVTDLFDSRPETVRSATWFLPRFEHALFGGVYTILRLMSWMTEHYGVEHRMVLFDGQMATDPSIREMVRSAFPNLGDIDIVLPPRHGQVAVDELPPTDIAVCSLWSSAYALARFNATKAKFYMVQDFEPSFYAAGTPFALAEATYRLGYAGLVNTPGLADVYATYGNPTFAFIPAVDFTVPDGPKPSAEGHPVQVVLYGRPSTDRNAFELIAVACHKLKARYGDRIRIVSAGEDFRPEAFDLGGVVENLGLLRDLESVRSLYATSDIGICFMLSKHPSYQPFEYLAARMAPVCNANAATRWLLRDGENCLITEPFPSCIADAVGRLVDDPDLRLKIASTGHEEVIATTWERSSTRSGASSPTSPQPADGAAAGRCSQHDRFRPDIPPSAPGRARGRVVPGRRHCPGHRRVGRSHRQLPTGTSGRRGRSPARGKARRPGLGGAAAVRRPVLRRSLWPRSAGARPEAPPDAGSLRGRPGGKRARRLRRTVGGP